MCGHYTRLFLSIIKFLFIYLFLHGRKIPWIVMILIMGGLIQGPGLIHGRHYVSVQQYRIGFDIKLALNSIYLLDVCDLEQNSACSL